MLPNIWTFEIENQRMFVQALLYNTKHWQMNKFANPNTSPLNVTRTCGICQNWHLSLVAPCLPLSVMVLLYTICTACRTFYLCCRWIISQGHFKLEERTDCGGTSVECSHDLKRYKYRWMVIKTYIFIRDTPTGLRLLSKDLYSTNWYYDVAKGLGWKCPQEVDSEACKGYLHEISHHIIFYSFI